MRYHYTYLTTNLVTYEFYVGVRTARDRHSGKFIDPRHDDYLGSGVRLKRSIAKYGRENFHKRVLRVFETREGAIEAEASHVDQRFLERLQPIGCMNLTVGGIARVNSDDLGARISAAKKGRPNGLKGKPSNSRNHVQTAEQRKHHSDALRGRKLTDEHKSRLSEARRRTVARKAMLKEAA